MALQGCLKNPESPSTDVLSLTGGFHPLPSLPQMWIVDASTELRVQSITPRSGVCERLGVDPVVGLPEEQGPAWNW